MHINLNKKVTVYRRDETSDTVGTVATVERVLHYQIPAYIDNDSRDESVINDKISTETISIMYCKIIDIIAHDIIVYDSERYEVASKPISCRGKFLKMKLKSLE